jgi:hypothetical protein
MPDLVQAVQQKLGLKYVDAKQLVAEARAVCEIDHDNDVPTERHDEVVEEACEIFKDYAPEQQARMKQQSAAATTTTTTNDVVPAWKQKALAACQKLETDHASKQAAATATAELQQRLREEGNVPEDQIASTKVTHVRPLPEAAAGSSPAPAGDQKNVTVRTYTCACVIQ